MATTDSSSSPFLHQAQDSSSHDTQSNNNRDGQKTQQQSCNNHEIGNTNSEDAQFPNNTQLSSASQSSLCSSTTTTGFSSGDTSPSKSPTNLHITTTGQNAVQQVGGAQSSMGSSSSGIESPGSFTAGSDSPASSVQSPPTPVPHTPLFSPQHHQHPLGQDSKEWSKEELPEGLLEAGWRKCYSKREQRWYFFNKLTQQSTWDTPEIGGKISRKRTSSEMEGHSTGSHGKQPYKKFIPSSDWDLTVHSNIRMPERVPFTLYPPHPDIEGKRLEASHRLRLQLQELSHAKDLQDVSLDTFNRWLLERKCDDKGRDPLISSECDIDISPSLLSSRHITPDQRKQIKWHGEAMFDWLRKTQTHSKFEEYLEQEYRYNCFDDRKFDLFLARVWCLLKRYQCLFGPMNQEALNLQRSLPVKAFQILTKEFGVTFEGFASPLNSYYRQYCSMFPDTDGYFGSRGSFLDFSPIEGSMALHPPFSEELISAAAEHVVRLLRCSENASGNFPMSAIVFLPDWQDPPLEGLETMEYSGFCRMKNTVRPSDHWFRHGGQHWIQNKKETHVRSTQGTTILLLQNSAGTRKWPVTEQKMSRLLEAFRDPMGHS